jgi:uncharacterized protein
MNTIASPAIEVDIAPRPLRTQWPADLPRHWYRGKAFDTHFMNALSLLFPNGEKFFIDAVRAYRDRNTDPKLERDIKAFISQEGWHRSAHRDYNDWLASLGLPVERCEARQARRLQTVTEKVPPRGWLAATVCLEHFTAIMAQDLLATDDRLEPMHPHFRRIWTWHALEELEHKAVAWDLFDGTGGRYGTRVKAMFFVTFDFAWQVGRNTIDLLRAEGELWKLRTWLDGARFLFGPRRGVVWKILPQWLAFFRRDYHPWQHDDRPLIRKAEAALAQPA